MTLSMMRHQVMPVRLWQYKMGHRLLLQDSVYERLLFTTFFTGGIAAGWSSWVSDPCQSPVGNLCETAARACIAHIELATCCSTLCTMITGTGRVARFELVPLAELGRPRIDVLCNMSGIFRDSFQNVVELLDDLFQVCILTTAGIRMQAICSPARQLVCPL